MRRYYASEWEQSRRDGVVAYLNGNSAASGCGCNCGCSGGQIPPRPCPPGPGRRGRLAKRRFLSKQNDKADHRAVLPAGHLRRFSQSFRRDQGSGVPLGRSIPFL